MISRDDLLYLAKLAGIGTLLVFIAAFLMQSVSATYYEWHQGDDIYIGECGNVEQLWGFTGQAGHWTDDSVVGYSSPDVINNLYPHTDNFCFSDENKWPYGDWYQWDGIQERDNQVYIFTIRHGARPAGNITEQVNQSGPQSPEEITTPVPTQTMLNLPTKQDEYFTHERYYISDFVIARGDPLVWESPTITSGSVWIIGRINGIYSYDYNSSLAIPNDTIYTLEPGDYTLYIQTAGDNGFFELRWDDGILKSRNLKKLYSDKPVTDYNAVGYDPRTMFEKAMLQDRGDDSFYKYNLSVREPFIRVDEMYEKDTGDLFLAGVTNVQAGHVISVIVDEKKFVGQPAVLAKNTFNTTLQDKAMNTYRQWNVVVENDIGELSPGQHELTVTTDIGGATCVPLPVSERYVPPVPTPEIKRYYSITGKFLAEHNLTAAPAPAVQANSTQLQNQTLQQAPIAQTTFDRASNPTSSTPPPATAAPTLPPTTPSPTKTPAIVVPLPVEVVLLAAVAAVALLKR